MIIRPDMRLCKIFDALEEFKYVSLKTAGNRKNGKICRK